MTGSVVSPTIGSEKSKRILARLRCRRCCNAGGSGRLVLADSLVYQFPKHSVTRHGGLQSRLLTRRWQDRIADAAATFSVEVEMLKAHVLTSLDGLPLSLTKGAGFKRLIEFLKPGLTLRSPRTVSRTLESLATKFALPQLNETLSKANESLQLIVVIWTSRIAESIIGIRVQFIQNWILELHTVSFRHIEGRHTGENTRETFLAELRSRGIREAQVGTVVCDNAANMTKAFNVEDPFDGDWQEVPTDEDECDEATQYEEPEGSSEEMTITSFHRVRCAGRTLQLAVNAGLREDERPKEVLELINATVNVFRRSSFWTERLKALCGKDLIPPAGTRWNSLVAALKRLTETDVFNSAIAVPKEFSENHPPKRISVGQLAMNAARFQQLLMLLKPLGDATDRLRSDSLTPCGLHVTISSCYTQVSICRTSERRTEYGIVVDADGYSADDPPSGASTRRTVSLEKTAGLPSTADSAPTCAR
ncbi:hypothetical protein HPB51_025802 [Rhipicephalus microplus]|uniref:DUF659 domain-containing protein n=1 Tax=Rhipicephalus microplus TaxID=6941 RepID=A0A9J6DE67_RHIMP|nr:hypothetical protein HPB51_025802 [Rhipicephalus microplus]